MRNENLEVRSLVEFEGFTSFTGIGVFGDIQNRTEEELDYILNTSDIWESYQESVMSAVAGEVDKCMFDTKQEMNGSKTLTPEVKESFRQRLNDMDMEAAQTLLAGILETDMCDAEKLQELSNLISNAARCKVFDAKPKRGLFVTYNTPLLGCGQLTLHRPYSINRGDDRESVMERIESDALRCGVTIIKVEDCYARIVLH